MELSSKRCRKARTLDLRPHLARMDLKRRCFLGHNPKNDPAGGSLGRHDQHNSRRRDSDDSENEGENEDDGDERKMELVTDSPPSRSIAALSPESDDVREGPLHHHYHHMGPSLNLSTSPSLTPTLMLMSSSPSHRKTLHISSSSSSSGSYSYSDDDGSHGVDRGYPGDDPADKPLTSPSSSSLLHRDRSSSSINGEERKTGNVNEGDEDKDSELAASEREQVHEQPLPFSHRKKHH